MATIRLQRSSEYVNRLREYGIYIDGQKKGVIRNGETVNFEVEAGEHTITAKIDWCTSPTRTFFVHAGETADFKVAGFKYANWIMPVGACLIVLHFVLRISFDYDYLLYAALPGFILLMYYITFGRKKYLSLTEQGSSFSNNTVINESDNKMLAGH